MSEQDPFDDTKFGEGIRVKLLKSHVSNDAYWKFVSDEELLGKGPSQDNNKNKIATYSCVYRQTEYVKSNTDDKIEKPSVMYDEIPVTRKIPSIPDERTLDWLLCLFSRRVLEHSKRFTSHVPSIPNFGISAESHVSCGYKYLILEMVGPFYMSFDGSFDWVYYGLHLDVEILQKGDVASIEEYFRTTRLDHDMPMDYKMDYWFT